MGFNFPNSPSVGQKYPTPALPGAPVWQWDGSAWKTIGGQGLGGIYISDIVPAGAPDNSLWWESDTGNLYIRYNDGDSSQWVIVVPATSLTGLVRYDVSQSLTAAQQTQGRQNVYAAPFDAMSYSGMQVNGAMTVSQELGYASPITSNGSICDSWRVYASGTMVLQSLVGQNNPISGMNYLPSKTTTAQASLGVNDVAIVYQPIEGYRVARLAWGTSNAQPLTIGFWSAHTRTGTYCVSVQNLANDRSYVTSYTHNTSDAWQFNTFTISAGDTTGTWKNDNTTGLVISFTLAAGSNYVASSANTWLAGNYKAVAGQVNGVGATTDNLRISGLVVLPGVEAPSAARSPLVMRPYDQELLTCQRYFVRKTFGANQMVGVAQAYNVGAVNGLVWNLVPNLRTASGTAVTASAAGHFSLQAAGGGGAAATGFTPAVTVDAVTMTFSGASGLVVGNASSVYANTAGAWIQVDARL